MQAPQSSQAAGAEKAKVKMQMPRMPQFDDKMKEREYLKGRLAAAFRIFGKYGYDEGMYICLCESVYVRGFFLFRRVRIYFLVGMVDAVFFMLYSSWSFLGFMFFFLYINFGLGEKKN